MDDNVENADVFQALEEFPRLSRSLQVDFGAASNRSQRHEINGDHYLIFRLGRYEETLVTSLPHAPAGRRFEESGYVMVVADGMGSPSASESASRAAITTLLQLVLYYGKWNLRIDEQIKREILERANRFLHYVDVSLSSGPSDDPTHQLETSLTATFGAGGDLCFAHVGHSRAYLLRDGELMRLTRDHTTESGLPRRRTPTLVEVNVRSRDSGHIVTQAIGMGGASGPMIDLGSFTLVSSDIVLLCTNGLTDAIADDALARVLASNQTSAQKSQALVDLAAAADAEDDVTAIVAQYGFTP